MFVLGITGGIGTGKSTVARLCAEAGMKLIDADQLSHELTGTGGLALKKIAKHFGSEFVSEGGLKRERMANLVFENKQALDELAAIIHKEVAKESRRLIQEYANAGYASVVMDFPIPIEEGFLDLCDAVIAVQANEGTRLERLELRGLSREAAKARMAVQMSPEEYRELADIELENNGSIAELKNQLNDILKAELGGRGIKFQEL